MLELTEVLGEGAEEMTEAGACSKLLALLQPNL